MNEVRHPLLVAARGHHDDLGDMCRRTMPQALLYVMSIGILGASAAFGMAGRVVEIRWGRTSDSVPRLGLALWWYGLATATLLAGAQNVLVLYGISALALHTVLFQLFFLGTALAVSGLAVHLLYLYTGRESILSLVLALFGSGAIVFTTAVVAGEPAAIAVDGGQARVLFLSPRAHVLSLWFLGALYVAQLAGSLAYAGAFRYVRDASQRYRIAMVSTGIALWGTAGLIAVAGLISDVGALDTLGATLLPLGPLAVLLGYAPPTWVRRRYGIDAVVA